jgi:NDP-sugar pyrophosphorylase family protein
MENVQVLLLATGENTKLQPITLDIPAPMLPVVDRPIMLYAVEQAARQGFKEQLVSLYHLSGHVEAYFGTGQRWGVSMDYLLQREAWGNAGAVKWAQSAIGQTCVVLPADAMVDVDLAEAVRIHRQNNNSATVVVHRQGAAGSATISLASIAVSMAEGASEAAPDSWYDTGVYIFEPEVFDYIPDRTTFDIQSQLLPALQAAGLKVAGFETHGYWNTIATFQDYHEAQRHILRSAWGNTELLIGWPALAYPAVEGRQIAPGIWVGRNHMIHPSARLSPPVYVGDNCQIGSEVELGPDAVIGSHVVIDDGATICHSTVLAHTYVGQLVNVDRRFVNKRTVVDLITSQSTEVVDTFLLDEAHTTILDSRLLRVWDVFLALVLALLSLVVTLPLALLCLLTSGHVFYRAPRLGGWASIYAGNRSETLPPLALLRFYTRKENGRYTPVGHWLEKWEGHRLPELWNVLKGDLHLVGVKALTATEAAHITEAWQQKRNEYQPGFTGLWYLQTMPGSSLDDTLISDAYYVATRSWREDLKIIKKTPTAWWRRARNQAASEAKIP